MELDEQSNQKESNYIYTRNEKQKPSGINSKEDLIKLGESKPNAKKNIMKKREVYAPFEYQRAYDYWEKQQQAHWLHSEVALASDINDWNFKLTPAERNLIGLTLKAFTQTEIVVEEYWSQKVFNFFPKPEIAMMCMAFANMECFDKETELLTVDGWKNVKLVTEEDSVAQYNLDTQEISFVKPKKVVSYAYNGLMHHYESKSTNICVTPNHDLILINPSTNKRTKRKSYEGKWSNFSYPNAGKTSSIEGVPFTNIDSLLVAIQADGRIRANCSSGKESWKAVSFNLSKKRKKDRLREILSLESINFSEKELGGDSTLFQFNLPIDFSLTKIKSFDFIDLQKVSYGYGIDFLKELSFWDGSINKDGFIWYNTNEFAVDKVQAIAIMTNFSCTKGVNRTKEQSKKGVILNGKNPKKTKDCYALTINYIKNSRNYPTKKEVFYDDKVYCVSVDTENLVSRRKGRVAFTGNTIHIKAYSYLNESLGIEDYEAFLYEPTAKAKIDRLLDVKGFKKEDIAKSLAVFSAFTEGVSLFSSFAILLSFSRFNKLKGVGQIINFSVKDESMHSEAGCWLFRTFIAENPDILTDELKKELYQAGRDTYTLEENFIDKAFELGDIEGLTAYDLKNFIKNRVNVKLGDIGLKPNYEDIDQESLKRMEWFDFMTVGVAHVDFFASRVTDYSKATITKDEWDEL